MEIAAGTLVTANVRLVKLLGEGGMGSVWVADHLSLKTQVAVKFISPELVRTDASMVERFNREAALSARIKSPNVVQIFDHGIIDDGPPYIVMELLEGESLEQRLERTAPLSIEQTVAIVAQTAKALNKAHKLGIVHRDIKPDNIFLMADEDELHVKVLDFGIAKQTGIAPSKSVTSTGTMIGTPEYMSPEQVLSAKGVDAATDLWALAVVAYRCLTGRVPFSGETLGSLCVAIANSTPTPPSELRPELPPLVDQWFAKALTKAPAARFGSARELAVTFANTVAPHGGGIADELSLPGALVGGPDWSGPHPAVSVSGSTTGLSEAVAAQTGGAAPTFSGTAKTPPPARSRRRLVALAAATALMVGSVLVLSSLSDDTDGVPAPAHSAAPLATANTVSDTPGVERAAPPSNSQATPPPSSQAAPSSSSSSLASSSAAPSGAHHAPPPRPPAAHATHRPTPHPVTTAEPAATTTSGKDRGF